MAQLVPIPILVVTVILLVRAEFRSDTRQIYVLKPLSTLLVILVALLSFLAPQANAAFTIWIAAGLILSLGGDVALMFATNKAFLVGLVLFLLAHVVYAVAFTVFNGFYPGDLVIGAGLLAIGAAIYAYLWPGLGNMKLAVALYILIICVMVERAASTFLGTAFTPTQAVLLTAGATLFWLSDLVLAVNRFRRPFRTHRLSLFLYYGGQLLIALSPSYFAT
ncbi:MAG: lysoplasmalogenase [Chloroflexi bacterium]|nr:lysoplasmalogenase [Chloroflexota bacterium]MBU1747469.1 lysoplasmalogenase [Chloroflexota bacterium]